MNNVNKIRLLFKRTIGSALLITVALLVVSCTSTGRNYVNSGTNETLETTILPNASKMFVYRIGRALPPGASRLGESQGMMSGDFERGDRPRSRQKPTRISAEKLQENVEFVVSASGYCREGFFVLDRNLSPQNLWLKGECREDATGEDLHLFGATKILNAQAWNNLAQ
jgi:hypothetical protein